ncbi:MAG: hypothetical protein LC799_17220, partial [Actinobacteria bacterium]|nr:hypothetical protein [Actinomycetota bacterium]
MTLATVSIGGLFSGLAQSYPAVVEYPVLWFTEFALINGVNHIGRIPPTGTPIAHFPVQGGGTHPVGITVGSDGALWFAMESGHIGRMPTSGAGSTSYRIEEGGQPHGITSGPDGALWFTFFDRDWIGRITTAGERRIYDLSLFRGRASGVDGGVGPAPPQSHSITVGPDGALWFTEFLADRIARFRPGRSPSLTEYQLPAGSRPHGIVTGPDGAMWFASSGRDSIGRITLDGEIQEFCLFRNCADHGVSPHEIAVGADGKLWFTELFGNHIDRFDPTIVQFVRFELTWVQTPSGPRSSEPGYLVAGPDRAMWFHERAGHKIGRI